MMCCAISEFSLALTNSLLASRASLGWIPVSSYLGTCSNRITCLVFPDLMAYSTASTIDREEAIVSVTFYRRSTEYHRVIFG